jgi:lipopolysaccharide export LptBFGC system permease protein LptF
MISLLAAVLIGYALGSFIERGPLAYLLCLPISPVIYLVVTFVFKGLGSQGMEMPAIDVLVLASIVQAPLMMLGVFFARRKAARNSYEV